MPINTLMPKVAIKRITCLPKLKSALTKSSTPESRKASIKTRLRAKARMLTSTDSIIRLVRSEPVVAPNTFCVLMLLIRIGVSASEKFIKLIAAMMTMRNDTQISR